MQTGTRYRPAYTIGRAALAALSIILLGPAPAGAQDAPSDREHAVMGHVQALERSFTMRAEDVVAAFERDRLAPSYLEQTTAAERAEIIDRVRAAAEDAGGAMLKVDDDGYVLSLQGEGAWDIRFRVEPNTPYRMTSLSITEAASRDSALELTEDNLASTFEALEENQGFSGVLYVKKAGEVIHEAAYGLANAETGTPVRLDTIFGVGSRPIDFTKAGIYMLAHNDALGLDDPITEYFDDVPSDKATMTISHLMSGQSGLPDFHGLPGDWDQDLAWIDRSEAERRILAQELLFEPGSERRHSHSAFGLLASIIERVSGQDYMAFLTEHFFEPAGMSRTGEYGDFGPHSESDFAVGGGPSFIGEPNIPPNWGKTSWLVKGSGGMYSTLGDLLRFYEHIRTSGVVGPQGLRYFNSDLFQLDGSNRGFELFSITLNSGEDEVYLFVNMNVSDDSLFRDLITALEKLVGSWREAR